MNAGELAWLYAGFLAGVVSTAIEEPAYAALFVLPLLLAIGEPPAVALFSLTIAGGVANLLNLVYQKFAYGGSIIHFEFLKSAPAFLGIVLGIALYSILDWNLLKILVALAMSLTGVNILLPRRLRVTQYKRWEPVLSFIVGLADTILGTTVTFALVRIFIGEAEILAPLLRAVQATEVVAIKQKIVIGGVLAGVGIFTGQRLIQCGRSKMAEYVTAIVMLATAVWIAVL
ncbi:hypothetical protein [Pyrobaculum ferrireducens]|uniref:Uncharacterized protein n=1 Tax=Pyrobaculum ferrireducens TaxID=1104324 RepID=G7VHE9_9CREN|nr:hypothetical protein [Pyrobaculum ferrireducens]AET33240.1 hypothetical protein P186_1835 [Pyrobaculum ferrireducens]